MSSGEDKKNYNDEGLVHRIQEPHLTLLLKVVRLCLGHWPQFPLLLQAHFWPVGMEGRSTLSSEGAVS